MSGEFEEQEGNCAWKKWMGTVKNRLDYIWEVKAGNRALLGEAFGFYSH